MSYLTEAFKQLNIIDEDLFPTDSEGLNKLKDFMKSDIDDEDLTVYDDTATNEDELKNSYDGKVILRCNVCKSYFFKEPKGVVIDAEAGLANVGDECCYCHNDMGYNVVGVVAPYAEGSVEADRTEDVHGESEDYNESLKRVNESKITADDLNRELDKCYGKYNLGCVYGAEDPLAFLRAVLKWAKAKSLRVYKTNGYYVSETIIPGVDSTGKRIESDTLKTFKTADIVFIDNYNKIDMDARAYVFDLVKERQGHVIVTVPTIGVSSLDAADRNLFVWLDDSGFDASLINNDKKGNLTEETNWDKLDHVINKFDKSRSERKTQPESEEPEDSNFSKIKRAFHKDDLTEETNWDKVKEVISNMKNEKKVSESKHYKSRKRVVEKLDIDRKTKRLAAADTATNLYNDYKDKLKVFINNEDDFKVSATSNGSEDLIIEYSIYPSITKINKNNIQSLIDILNSMNSDLIDDRFDIYSFMDFDIDGSYILDIDEIIGIYDGDDLDNAIANMCDDGIYVTADSHAFYEDYDAYDDDLGESLKNVNEDLKDVSITTDDTKIQMKSEENGKVTVTTEPVRDAFATEDAEVIKPLSAADKATIADNDSAEDGGKVLDDAGLDFDEINDEDLDELGEKYFTNVYDNVKSFKSTLCKLTESGVVLEGKIKFKSGKEAKTSFNFNEAYVTKTGKVKLIGENAQFAKNKKAFTLTGSLKNKKLVVESFTYNYRAKDEKTGKSTRLYGTISK